MLTMEALREHALKNPTRLFPLNDCEQCLAADLTGRPMAGHDRFVGDSEPALPRAWVSFSRGVSSARFHPDATDKRKYLDSRGTLTGAQIAAALDLITAGADPYRTGAEGWLNAV